MGDEFLQEGEEAEEDGTKEDAAGEDEEVEGAPHVEAPSVMVLPKDSDIEEDDVPLAVRVRAHVVLSDEDLSGFDVGAHREEASSSRTHVEVTQIGRAHV